MHIVHLWHWTLKCIENCHQSSVLTWEEQQMSDISIFWWTATFLIVAFHDLVWSRCVCGWTGMWRLFDVLSWHQCRFTKWRVSIRMLKKKDRSGRIVQWCRWRTCTLRRLLSLRVYLHPGQRLLRGFCGLAAGRAILGWAAHFSCLSCRVTNESEGIRRFAVTRSVLH